MLMSLVGMAVLILIAVLLSSNARAINLRTVIGAFIIQVVIGALVLYVPVGRRILGMSEGVANVIAYGNEGISFIFLADWFPTKCMKSLAVGFCIRLTCITGNCILLVIDCGVVLPRRHANRD